MNKIELGEKIRILRKARKLRQEDLCAKAGVSIRVVKDIESGGGNPTIDNLDSILSVLGIPLSKILMTGMKAFDSSLVNAQRSIKSEESDDKHEEANSGVSVGRLREPNSNTHRNEDQKSDSRKPPHKMSTEIDNMSHTISSEASEKILNKLEIIDKKIDKKQAQSMDPNRQELFDLVLGLPKDLLPDAITDIKALIEAASDESQDGSTRKRK